MAEVRKLYFPKKQKVAFRRFWIEERRQPGTIVAKM